MDNLVQFEEDFNSGTKSRWGQDGYLRPDQFLDHLTVIKNLGFFTPSQIDDGDNSDNWFGHADFA